MTFTIDEDKDEATNMEDILRYINDAMQTCAFGDTGTEIRFLTPKAIAEVATQDNIVYFFIPHPENRTTGSRRRARYSEELYRSNSWALFVGTLLAGGDMTWLFYLGWGRRNKLTDADLPLGYTCAGMYPSKGPQADFVEIEPVLCAQPIRKSDFFNEPGLFYRSSLPFARVVQKDNLKTHEGAEAAYEMNFNHDVVGVGFDTKSYLLTEFPCIPENGISARAVAGLVCDGKFFLISEMDPAKVQVMEGAVQWLTGYDAEDALRARKAGLREPDDDLNSMTE